MVVKRGKKAIPWEQDVEILARLRLVETLWLQGAKPHEIASAMDYSLRTAHRDIERVQTILRKQSIDDITAARDRSIAELREILMRQWEIYRECKDQKLRLIALRDARDTEKLIIELEGTKKPVAVDVTSQGEKIEAVPIAIIKMDVDEL